MYIKRSVTASLGSGQVSPNDYTLARLFGAEPNSNAGVSVNESSLFGLPAFKAGVEKISSTVARCDLYPYRILPNDGREIKKDDPNYWLLNWKANSWQSSASFIQTLVANACYSHGGFALYDPNTPALYNLDSKEVWPVEIKGEAGQIEEVYYSCNGPNGRVLKSSNEIIHIRNLAIGNGVYGHDITENNKTAVGMSIAQYEYSAVFFKNGQHIRKVIMIPGWLTPEQRDETIKSVQNLKGGLNNAHGITTLQGGATLQTLPEDGDKSQLVEAMQNSIIDIANLLNMSPYFLGADQGVSYGSIEADTENFLNVTIDPWLTQIENELTMKLIPPTKQGITDVIEFERESLIETSPAYKTQVMTLYQAGLYSFEQAAAKLNLPTVKTGEYVGDTKEPEPEPEQPQEKTDDKAEPVVRATLERLKKRILKSVESNKLNLTAHEETIRSSLPGLNVEPLLTTLNNMQEEIKEVLPEQRIQIIEGINCECITKQILN